MLVQREWVCNVRENMLAALGRLRVVYLSSSWLGLVDLEDLDVPQPSAIMVIVITRLNKELWSLTWTLPPCQGHGAGSAVPVTFSRQGFDTSAAELTNCCPLALSTLHWT